MEFNKPSGLIQSFLVIIFNMNLKKLDPSFFEKDTPTIAKNILGMVLETNFTEGKTSGRIVETEAYLGFDDPASHAFNGQTLRNSAMFGPPGSFYIYFTYGMYYCMNIVTAPKGKAEAVLIRAVEPLSGIEIMKKRRGKDTLLQLTNGPAKLVQALGITKDLNGRDIKKGPVLLLADPNFKILDETICTSERIGISKARDLPLRFYINKNPFVSNP